MVVELNDTSKVFGKIILIILAVVAVIAILALLFLSFYPSIGKLPDKDAAALYASKTPLYYDDQFHSQLPIT